MQVWWLVAITFLIIWLLSGFDIFLGFLGLVLILLSFGALFVIAEKLEESKNTKDIGEILGKFTVYLLIAVWLIAAFWSIIA